MTLTTAEIARLALAFGLLLTVAHVGGLVCARMRQPVVVGEILGGLLLGPSLLGAVLPAVQSAIFPPEGASAAVLAAAYQLGLLLMMFVAGAELRSVFHREERATAAWLTATGTLLPFALGVALVQVVDLRSLQGPAGDETAFVLVFGLAIAVTSIPVISRIMLDLGILDTLFARIVLSAAVIEDVVVYVVLAVAVGLVQHQLGGAFGLPEWTGLEPTSAMSLGYHVLASAGFFAVLLWHGPPIVRRLLRSPWNAVERRSPVAFRLLLIGALTGLCACLGVTPLFGAFVAGIVARAAGGEGDPAEDTIRRFALATFVPVYFASVGLHIDLVGAFEPLFFVGFLGFACLVKALSTYAGARLAGQGRYGATNLAVAMNARGGPGIVLASVAFDAGIIGQAFFGTLVLLAVVTSVAAGWWLERLVRGRRPLLVPESPAGARWPIDVAFRTGDVLSQPDPQPRIRPHSTTRTPARVGGGP
jgi:Kef-type K+ transport system membrane component KefB